MFKVNRKAYLQSIATLTQHVLLAGDMRPKSDITKLARRLVKQAAVYDVEKAENTLAIDARYRCDGIERDPQNPSYYDHEAIIGKAWADDSTNPLQENEQWNEGRRKAAALYNVEKGVAENPYIKTGLKGRGILGGFGPNHAVDSGALQIAQDSNGNDVLKVLTIVRADNNKPAFAGGFVEWKKDADGTYRYDLEKAVETQAKEFFEEMVSGSVDLMPEYERQIEPRFHQQIESLELTRKSVVGDDERHEIKNQIIAELKVEQVETHDPGFFARLKDVIWEGTVCFNGPVLNEARSTDNAWIESYLSWYMMDDDAWDYIKGDDKFGYDIVPGDDATAAGFRELDARLVLNASASHGPMMCYMAASYILAEQRKGREIAPSIMKQLSDIADELEAVNNHDAAFKFSRKRGWEKRFLRP